MKAKSDVIYNNIAGVVVVPHPDFNGVANDKRKVAVERCRGYITTARCQFSVGVGVRELCRAIVFVDRKPKVRSGATNSFGGYTTDAEVNSGVIY